MKILYLGESAAWSTSRHRADALTRLGHTVDIWDPAEPVKSLRRSGLLQRLHNLSGQALLVGFVEKWLNRKMSVALKPDLIWVNSGELLSLKAVEVLRKLEAPLVLYNNDDPTGPRDGNRFRQVRKALSRFDLCVALRKATADEMLQLGAKRTLVVPFSYDEIQHRALGANEKMPDIFRSDIVFVGTWMRDEKRDAFLDKLRRAELRVNIWGPRWKQSRCKDLVGECLKGPWISGRQYVHAIAGAKLAIGMVSKRNRDEHTQRSVEVPYAGGLLCAERTAEHMRMLKDGEEAVFWSSPEECIQVCRDLLANEGRRRAIVANGMRKVRELKVGNEDVCRGIVEELLR